MKKRNKKFTLTDKSGRTMKVYKLDENHIEKTWDLSEQDWDNEITLGEFIKNCSIGDCWNNDSVKIQCV